jgi:hypothetical protein
LIAPAPEGDTGAAAPPAPQASSTPGGEPDWAPYFEAAGLSIDAFTPVTPSRPPPLYADRLAAWTGAFPGQETPPLVVEAAARNGTVVFWGLREQTSVPAATDLVGFPPIALVAFALMWIGAGILARRHLKSGSGDRRGALRLGAVVAWVAFIGPLLQARHTTSTAGEFSTLFAALSQGTMFGAIAWLLYMALEPYARRTAPRWVVSWTRLLEGRFKDPMVGRDLLTGLAAAAAASGLFALIDRLRLSIAEGTIDWAYPHGFAPLRGVLATLANLIHPVTLLVPFGIMSLLILSRALIKRPWPAIAAAAVVIVGFGIAVNGFDLGGLAVVLVVVGVGARFGLLALVAFSAFIINFLLVPISADPAVWWTSASWLGWGALTALALYGCRIATARAKIAASRT